MDTAGWLQRTKSEKGASSLSIVQSRKNLMRAHVVALVLDGQEVGQNMFCVHFLSIINALIGIIETVLLQL